ncbi:biotin-dependent carboxyltransferase family protein [uncultured Paracoccus sp.]|uniref:5-oxoprolinase subunit C family protein n=1 Tax=uncultured Paracoccus sp. TaxID=189685 RepID=UPI002610223F|nr:biotin-dependent carboxyltransferase family protein [uncultured Paracoccus sp.]
MSVLQVIRADGILTVQDLGRPGHIAQGLSRGGAMDRLALIEAAALLGRNTVQAGIEMAGAGGVFTVDQPMRIALTGAPMTATLDGAPLRWQASHRIEPGESLRIGGAQSGAYSYLTTAGGIATPDWLGSRAAHLTIGIGAVLKAGSRLPAGADPDPDAPSRTIAVANRFAGGTVRIIDGPQTAIFSDEVLAKFAATEFTRAAHGNRQGVRLDAESRFTAGQTGIASDMVQPGDLQMIGDGVPYVLLAECQTMGGYPRIGTVIPTDLPLIAQAPPGARIRFLRIGLDQADGLYRDEVQLLRETASRCRNLVRDPAQMADLLSYQLVGGVTRGDELEETECRSI